MPVPTHRANCKTVMWETNCPNCSRRVYFFMCTCGSKVFFDQNSPPWNPHSDHCIPYQYQLARQAGSSVHSLATLITSKAEELGVEVPEIAEDYAEYQAAQDNSLKIHTIEPGNESIRVGGTVHTMNIQVNFLKRFRFDNEKLGKSLLGRLGRAKHAEIVLRTPVEKLDHSVDEYTFFFPLAGIKENGVRAGTNLLVDLEPHKVAGRSPLWVGTDVLIVPKIRKTDQDEGSN